MLTVLNPSMSSRLTMDLFNAALVNHLLDCLFGGIVMFWWICICITNFPFLNKLNKICFSTTYSLHPLVFMKPFVH